MSIVRYSKPSIAVIKNKTSFFEENARHLEYVRRVNKLYMEQPLRTVCKTCSAPLGEAQITVQGVPYTVCDKCGHLNGLHEDTTEFAETVYSADQGSAYSVNYKNNFNDRVQDIYAPKAEFLKDVLEKESITEFQVTDIGCGAGHFVAACEQMGIKCDGYDTNQVLIDLGSSMLVDNTVSVSDFADINELIASVSTPVLTLIGVLEHLMQPLEALKAFRKSAATYLYLQVPLFSLSVILESAHEDIFPRQLNAGHTHLYTESSLNYLKKRFNLETVGEWWFGTDMVDLFRHMTNLAKVDSAANINIVNKFLGDHIDNLQAVLDSKKLCSGVNMVLKKA